MTTFQLSALFDTHFYIVSGFCWRSLYTRPILNERLKLWPRDNAKRRRRSQKKKFSLPFPIEKLYQHVKTGGHQRQPLDLPPRPPSPFLSFWAPSPPPLSIPPPFIFLTSLLNVEISAPNVIFCNKEETLRPRQATQERKSLNLSLANCPSRISILISPSLSLSLSLLEAKKVCPPIPLFPRPEVTP